VLLGCFVVARCREVVDGVEARWAGGSWARSWTVRRTRLIPPDAQWALIGPFLQVWKAKRPSPSSHEGCYELREIVNALFYQNRTGCQWALLPHDLPLMGRAFSA
jgi:hypothetical protein